MFKSLKHAYTLGKIFYKFQQAAIQKKTTVQLGPNVQVNPFFNNILMGIKLNYITICFHFFPWDLNDVN